MDGNSLDSETNGTNILFGNPCKTSKKKKKKVNWRYEMNHIPLSIPTPSVALLRLTVRDLQTKLPIGSGSILCERKCNAHYFQKSLLPSNTLKHWLRPCVPLPTWSETVWPLCGELNSDGDKGNRSKLIPSSKKLARGFPSCWMFICDI